MELSAHRSAFSDHPRFPQQSLLIASHDVFAEMARAFVARVETIAAGQGLSPRQQVRFSARLAGEFRAWQWSMSCHERYEESKLYPFLSERFGVSCDDLSGDHRRLHELADGCEGLLAAEAARAGQDGRFELSEVAGALAGYCAELEAHLIAEETRVIPLLLELAPAEFERYDAGESCAVPDTVI
jgi:hypothetical protein